MVFRSFVIPVMIFDWLDKLRAAKRQTTPGDTSTGLLMKVFHLDPPAGADWP
jgi:hypothetical protein